MVLFEFLSILFKNFFFHVTVSLRHINHVGNLWIFGMRNRGTRRFFIKILADLIPLIVGHIKKRSIIFSGSLAVYVDPHTKRSNLSLQVYLLFSKSLWVFCKSCCTMDSHQYNRSFLASLEVENEKTEVSRIQFCSLEDLYFKMLSTDEKGEQIAYFTEEICNLEV